MYYASKDNVKLLLFSWKWLTAAYFNLTTSHWAFQNEKKIEGGQPWKSLFFFFPLIFQVCSIQSYACSRWTSSSSGMERGDLAQPVLPSESILPHRALQKCRLKLCWQYYLAELIAKPRTPEVPSNPYNSDTTSSHLSSDVTRKDIKKGTDSW